MSYSRANGNSSAHTSEMSGYPAVTVNDDEPLVNLNSSSHRGTRFRIRKGPKCSCCFRCCMFCACISMVVFAIVAIGLGVSYDLINHEVDVFIGQQAALTNGSQGTDNWSKPGAPVRMSFYLFNITNKEGFLNGSRPIVTEIGPVVYNENKTKYDLVWNDDETVLGYKEITSYSYNEDLSQVSPSTNITTINLPLIGILLQFEKLMNMVRSLPPSFQELVKQTLSTLESSIEKEFQENLIMTRSIDEIIWGYNDSFLGFIYDLNISLINDALPDGPFFSLEKRTSTALYNMVYTGKGSSHLTAKYIMYDGKTSVSGWGSPYAGMINGTEALLFHPGVDKSERLEIYVSELFRSGYFSFKEETSEYGIDMYKFVLPKEELNGSSQDRGFFMNGPEGVLNLTAVFPLNVPIFVSKPRFLDADPVYLENVTCPKPNASKHDSYLCIEPVTGAVLDAAKRLQINIQLREYDSIKELSKLRPMTYLPLFWVEEAGKLNSTLADKFKQQVYLPRNAIKYGLIGLVGLLGLLAVVHCFVFSVLLMCSAKRKNDNLSIRSNDP